jgi:vancomycin permeability regulator SanA
MTDAQIQAKASIAAALIQSRTIDAEGLASPNKDISSNKLAHLRELTNRIYAVLAADA